MPATAQKTKVYSMTGFGRGVVARDGLHVQVELRSVNSRFLDVRPKLPRNLSGLEPKVRETITSGLKRGSVDVVVAVQTTAAAQQAKIDESAVEFYLEALQKVAKKNKLAYEPDLVRLIKLPGVISTEEGISSPDFEAKVGKILEKALQEALDNLLEMRAREGLSLQKVMQRELAGLLQVCKNLRQLRAEANDRLGEKLRDRLAKKMAEIGQKLDASRLEQEVVFYLDRSDITEESDRLDCHLKQMDQLLSADANGKRMDFLVQEIGRELNTIGSKSDHAEISKLVVDGKVVLEKIREQVQNIE